MLVSYILLIFSASNCFCVQRDEFPEEFFRIVDIDISHEQTDSISELPSFIQMRFSAFGRHFAITASKSVPVDPEIAVKVTGNENYTFIWEPPMYEGKQNLMTFTGMYNLLTNTVLGFVTENRVTYYIEPAMYLFPEYGSNSEMLLVNRIDDHLEYILHPSPYRIKPNVSATCFMELMADNTVYEAMNKDIDSISSKMYLHARYASSVLQNTNFRDKVLQLSPKKITIKTVPKDSFHSDPFDYMYYVGDATSNVCILAIFTDRVFGSVDGIALSKSACAEYSDDSQRSNRLMVMSKSIDYGKILKLALSDTLTTFAHEVGHAFGAEHNLETGDPNCIFTYSRLRYLLSDIEYKYYLFRTARYSPCNIRLMNNYVNFVQREGECLKISMI